MARRQNDIPAVKTFADHHIITRPNPLRGLLSSVGAEDFEDPVARAEKALADLSFEFNDWMSVECDRLAGAHTTILKDGFTPPARNELFRAAHDIKGSAATFGYPSAGVAADSLCRIIEHAPELDKVPGDLIAHHINAIQAIVRENATSDNAEIAAKLNRRLRAVADEYLASVNRDRPDHLDAILSPSLVPVP